jgi:hypothetical protein
MSVYVLSSEKNVLNIPKLLEGLDVNTRNNFFATILGLDAGVQNEGRHNVFIGYRSGNRNKLGIDNVYMGTDAGFSANNDNNVYLGCYAGKFSVRGTRNVFLGAYAGQFNDGTNNIFIGYKCTNFNEFINASSNIGIGNDQFNLGHQNISIGRESLSKSIGSIIMGNYCTDYSQNSILIGNGIYNEGSNCFIIHNTHTSNSTSNIFSNSLSNYMNINDVFVVQQSNENTRHMNIANVDVINLRTPLTGITLGETIKFTACNSGLDLDVVVRIGGKYSSIVADKSLTISAESNVVIQPAALLQHTLQVNKLALFDDDVYMLKRLRFGHCNMFNIHWDVYLHNYGRSNTSDLVLRSRNNTMITFTDDFSTEVLNFTGKHRCSRGPQCIVDGYNISNYMGKIVVSTGKYCDLHGQDQIHIDEALPIVEVSRRRYDARVFGVIGGIEQADESRCFQIGNVKFGVLKKKNDVKLIINSHGEGGIWVCDENGLLKNGDLIAASSIPGFGMKQQRMSKTISSYTVAKITCDCDFTTKAQEFFYRGKIFKKQFVGCVYKV